jgi:putative tryptophan/tyrosine transport system substrate-binding protein
MTVVSGQLSVVSENTGAKLMSGKIFVWLLTTFLLGTVPAEAQQTKKIPRIGYLSPFSSASEPNKPIFEAFHQGLRQLGWIPGQNVKIEYRWADEKYDRLPELAAELVRLDVDVIFTVTTFAARAAKRATSTTPIVFTGLGDPLSSGLITSLSRPQENVTGIGGLALELSGKRLELLKEVVPNLMRVAVLANPSNTVSAASTSEIHTVAKALGLKIQLYEVSEAEKIAAAFAAMTKQKADGLMVFQDPMLFSQAKQVLALVLKRRLPAVYVESGWVPAGGLMSYAPSITDLHRRAARYVDKILKGAKPADLPVERPSKFEFVINLKAAKQIGLAIPPNVLARADRVIR